MNQSKIIRLNFKRTFMIVLALCLLVGCTKNIRVTPTDRLTYMYKVYNAQYEDYQAMANNPATTEAQKVIMRKKKPILDKLGVLIPAFDRALQTGTVTPSQEQIIYDLLNSLEGM